MTIGRTLQIRTVTESMAMLVLPAALLLGLVVGSIPSPAVDFPEAEISNGQLTAKIYLPDAKSVLVAE